MTRPDDSLSRRTTPADGAVGFLRIGPFSRASSLSVKALRAYHEQGLLVPALVDPDTGYRVYGAEQLFDAAVLRRLRELDVPLRQVREVLEARDPIVTERVLADHAQVMRQRLDDTLRIIDELQRGIERPEIHTPVHVRVEPAVHALTTSAEIAIEDFAAFLGDAFGRLVELVGRLGAEMIDVPGGLYPQEITDDGVERVTAFVPIARPVAVPAASGSTIGEIPGGPVAVAVHVGGYHDIADTYRLLGGWVATSATPRDAAVRERYVVGPPEPVEAYRTEIHWPVVAET